MQEERLVLSSYTLASCSWFEEETNESASNDPDNLRAL